MNKPVDRRLKKPYVPPTLTVYGTIRELTKAVGNKLRPDGGRFPKNATSINGH